MATYSYAETEFTYTFDVLLDAQTKENGIVGNMYEYLSNPEDLTSTTY